MSIVEEILSEWFGPDESPSAAVQKRWWQKDDAFDAHVRDRFGAHIQKALDGDYDDWADETRSALALVILLDQFTRNVSRGTAEMYAGDAKAVHIAEELIARGGDTELDIFERQFLYMPLMHIEDVVGQERCVALFAALSDEDERMKGCHDYAIAHHRIVARFDRFPHRNELLGRESTSQEVEFLKEPGSSF